MDWSMLHDASLREIQFDWSEGAARLLVIYFDGSVRRTGIILAESVFAMACGRAFPWGESQLINEAGVEDLDGRRVLRIEMQSGDEISVQAQAFSFLTGEPVG